MVAVAQSVSNVELVFTSAPNHYTLNPTPPHDQRTTPQGQHVISVPTFGYNEWFTIEVIGFGTAPGLVHLRSDDGAAEQVPMMPQRIFPRWVNWLSGILVLTGAVLAAHECRAPIQGVLGFDLTKSLPSPAPTVPLIIELTVPSKRSVAGTSRSR